MISLSAQSLTAEDGFSCYFFQYHHDIAVKPNNWTASVNMQNRGKKHHWELGLTANTSAQVLIKLPDTFEALKSVLFSAVDSHLVGPAFLHIKKITESWKEIALLKQQLRRKRSVRVFKLNQNSSCLYEKYN